MADALAQDTGSATGSLTGFEILSLVCAAVLAGVLIWAAVAKLRASAATTADFTALGLPQAGRLALAVPAAELAIAGLLLVVPGWGGVAAFGLLALFTAFLVAIIRGGSTASCACFGGSARAPVSARHVLRNGVLAVLALLAVPFPGSTTNLF